MLKPEDGFQRGRAELRSEVAHLQKMLAKAGYNIKNDGFYGPATEGIVGEIQQKHDLKITGEVDDNTWNVIEKEAFLHHLKHDDGHHAEEADTGQDAPTHSDARNKHANEIETGFSDFKGQLEWIHNQEGHAGKPYWPGGRSGVTLDPGFDLGYQDVNITHKYYRDILNEEQLEAIETITGKRGREAKNLLNHSAALLSIRTSKSQASRVFPHIALPYWKAIGKRMTGLNNPKTPGSVQTAVLSLAINRGYNNADLEMIKAPIKLGDWMQCATLISTMQQDHQLEGIRKRRQREGQLIVDDLI